MTGPIWDLRSARASQPRGLHRRRQPCRNTQPGPGRLSGHRGRGLPGRMPATIRRRRRRGVSRVLAPAEEEGFLRREHLLAVRPGRSLAEQARLQPRPRRTRADTRLPAGPAGALPERRGLPKGRWRRRRCRWLSPRPCTLWDGPPFSSRTPRGPRAGAVRALPDPIFRLVGDMTANRDLRDAVDLCPTCLITRGEPASRPKQGRATYPSIALAN
jgi:hypothetical protein